MTHHLPAQSYGVVVSPGEEASLQYSFTPNKQLHPREFSVALTAFYSSAAGEARLYCPLRPAHLDQSGSHSTATLSGQLSQSKRCKQAVLSCRPLLADHERRV